MQSYRVVHVEQGSFRELAGYLGLSRAQNNARLPFPLGLRLSRHGVFQRLRNVNVADLDRLNCYAPWVRFFVQYALQLFAEHLALRDHLRQIVAADGFPQSRLRAHGDSLVEIHYLQNRLLGVPHQPEYDGVYVDRYGIARQCRLGFDISDANALVHVLADGIDHRDDKKDAWSAQADVAAQPQHSGFLPLFSYFDRKQEIQPDHRRNYRRRLIVVIDRWRQADGDANHENRYSHSADLRGP